MFLDWKNQYCENEYTTQSNLQIQCNPCQVTNGIFYTSITKYLYGDTKDPKQPKQSLGKKAELEESDSLTSDYTTKLQSSRQYGTGTKTEIQINGTRQKAQR